MLLFGMGLLAGLTIGAASIVVLAIIGERQVW